MHLHVLLYKSKIYLFLINYLFIIAWYESCFYLLYIVDKYLFIAKIQISCWQLLPVHICFIFYFKGADCHIYPTPYKPGLDSWFWAELWIESESFSKPEHYLKVQYLRIRPLLNSYSQQMGQHITRVTANWLFLLSLLAQLAVKLARQLGGSVGVHTATGGALHHWEKEVFRPRASRSAC